MTSDTVMDIRSQFPGVHWVWRGAISFVYEVDPHIVVKVPKSGEFEREQFLKELKIYEIFSRHRPCPSVVQCFFYTGNGIFLEYMRGATLLPVERYIVLTVSLDASLSSRIQNNHIRDPQTTMVSKVEKLEPLHLRMEWMNDLAQAVAFLESLNLAHGDLRPENILLDRNRLKLSDFDCTAEIGTDFEACMAPYGRLLNSNETDQGRRGTSGSLGPRTEQFALGSLYYLINYGFEVYGDQCLTEDPKEHGPAVVDLLQNMVFPKLNGDLIDNIIWKCWHNKYATVAELAANTETVLTEASKRKGTNAETISTTRWRTVIGRIIHGLWWTLVRWSTNGGATDNSDDILADFSSKKAFCQDLEKRGLLRLFSSGEPEQLGFSFEWYRHRY
ncbi:hypothetical protein FQN54_004890 [Arachnomyces sp. PD_36]|nr:hypothetical protein FQN54_004890 [Arachnomyces sp. PD_36]